MRLDHYLAKQNPSLSRNYWQKVIKEGHVKVNNAVITQTRFDVQITDTIEITNKLSVPLEKVNPENIPLDIVFEDEHILIINKPAGLVVHPAPGHYTGTLVNALLYHCNDLSTHDLRPGIIHRLDKDTTGLIAIAKTDEAHFDLTQQFTTRSIKREYIALVKSVPSPSEGTIDAPIMKDPKNYDRMKVDLYSDKAKEAVTHYKVIKIYGDQNSPLYARFSLILCQLETGRTHQIRVHMQYKKWPILGDPIYGYKVPYLNRQFLHAQKLNFIHPKTKKLVEFETNLPEDLEQCLKHLED